MARAAAEAKRIRNRKRLIAVDWRERDVLMTEQRTRREAGVSDLRWSGL
jgi:hypothetical protein